MEKIKIFRADDHFLYRGFRVINFRPILLISLSFGLGIFLSFFLGFRAFYINAGWFIALAAFFVYKKISGKNAWIILLFSALLCAFYSVGVLAFGARISSFEKDAYLAGEYAVIGEVKEISESADYTVYELGDLVIADGENLYMPSSRMQIYVYGSSQLEIGSRCAFDAQIRTNEAYTYGRVNASAIISQIRYSANVDPDKIILSSGGGTDVFESVRKDLRGTLFENMDGENASLAYAMLTGSSGLIEEDVLQNFRYGGIAHIFAVSGLHIGVIYGLLNALCRRIRMHRVIQFAVIFAILFFYCGVCGFSPSSVRALVMCTVLMFSETCGMQYDRLNSVSFAALILLAVDPVYLFSVGFQLSVAAAAGIIVLGGHLSRSLRRIQIANRRMPEKVCSAIGVAFSAQLSTFPILIDCFGYVSGISFILNLLFIPLISAVYSILFVAAVLACIFSFAAAIILFVPEFLLKLAVMPVMMLEFKVLLICGFSFGGCAILWYLAMFFVSDKINLKALPKCIGTGILCAALIALMLLRNIMPACDALITLHSYYGSNAIFLRQDSQNYMICVGEIDGKHLERLFLTEGIRALDGVIILAPASEINTSVPLILQYANIQTLYVSDGVGFVNTFHTLQVETVSGFFSFGESSALFIGADAMYLNVEGAEILICADEPQEDVPDVDILLTKESYAFMDGYNAKMQICFEMAENKISLYSMGDLQITLKDGIISLKKSG